jgi:hypothetical protein
MRVAQVLVRAPSRARSNVCQRYSRWSRRRMMSAASVTVIRTDVGTTQVRACRATAAGALG